ncbi:MAG: AMP-binding protein [Deltaproteobacteria bacterium]|nr:AMP-binding protein [Deltaproteobacteria bacterium]
MHLLKNTEASSGAARFARTLDRCGVARRGSVACLLANTPEYLFAYRGATWSGRRFTPMSSRWQEDEVAYVVDNSEAECLVVDARYADRIGEAARLVPADRRFAVRGEIDGFRSWQEVEGEDGSPYESSLAGNTMLYTSGTTGRPKGVLRPPVEDAPPPTRTGAAGRAMMSAFLPEGARDGIHLVAAPLYHAGPNTYCDGALLLGADVVLMERFDAEAFLAAVESHRATSTFLVPTHFVRLLRLPEAIRKRYDLSSLQLVCHGAAPVSVAVKRAMIDWWGPVLFEFYGGTEGGGNMISSEEWLRKPGSVGRPRPGQRLRILDDEGDEVRVGQEGLVCFELDEAPFEYKGDPEKTRASRRGEDFFTLGDVGYVDEDGYLFLCDRSSDVIISGAVNIYPSQIESILMELDYVADCCVVGIPNEEWGEEVRAVVQLEASAKPEDPAGAILRHCRQRLSGYQVPRGVDFEPDLPRTETGKLARQAIRKRYWGARARRV